MPLPLLLGRMTSWTPCSSSQGRRTSPGVSLNRRNRPSLFQSGPSVNVNPVASFSTSASWSTSSKSFSDLTSTAISAPLRAVRSRANVTRRLGRLHLLDVDPRLRLSKETAVPAGADRQDLAKDRQRRLGRGVGADVEAGW